MNSIRALNVRARIDENSRSYLNPEPDTSAPSSGIAPLTPSAEPVAEKPATALGSNTPATNAARMPLVTPATAGVLDLPPWNKIGGIPYLQEEVS